jgi:SHAQKYF class myb-like DNA-binding protein
MEAQCSQGAEQLASNEPIINEGKWTSAEHEIFLAGNSLRHAGLKARGCDWNAIAEQVRTRTAAQVRSHAQKYFNKQANDQEKIGFNREMIIGGETESTITRSKIERPKIEATPLTKNTQEKQKEQEK